MKIRTSSLVPLESSSLMAIGYQPRLRNLIVKFRNGSVYVYHNVDRGTVEGLLKSPSHGSYFAHNIRNSFVYEKVR